MGRKVKYALEFKLRCVGEVLKHHRTIGSVAVANGCDESNVRKWIGFYKKYGSNGLLPRKNQIYDVDFKLKVLGAIDKEFLSLRQACVKFNIPSDSVIIKWQRTYASDGPAGLTKPKGRPPMTFKRAKKKSDKPLTREEELLKENEALRAENALLKKFNALIQAEELQQKQKRKP